MAHPVGQRQNTVARVDAETGAIEQIAAGYMRGVAFGDRAAWSVSGSFDGAAAETISRIESAKHTVTAAVMAKIERALKTQPLSRRTRSTRRKTTPAHSAP